MAERFALAKKNLIEAADSAYISCRGDYAAFARECESLLAREQWFPASLDQILPFLKENQAQKQHFEPGRFGDYSLTLARGEHTFVDLYVWSNKHTSYHSHHFAGAFKVIAGKARQISLKFREEEDHGFLKSGELSFEKIKELCPGDTQSIDLGLSFIHKNFYVDRPGMTVCLRSNDFSDQKLYEFFYPGLALTLGEGAANEIKALEFLNFLATNNMLADGHIEDFCEQISSATRYKLLLDIPSLHPLWSVEGMLDKVRRILKKGHELDPKILDLIDAANEQHFKFAKRDLRLLKDHSWVGERIK